MEGPPEAVAFPSGFQPKLGDNNAGNNPLDNCLIFVLHFCVPSYIYTNYCFLVTKKDMSDYERLGMKFNDLQKENVALKDLVQTQQQQIDQLLNKTENARQVINTLIQRLKQLETRVDRHEAKRDEIQLNLQNNWQRSSNDYHIPKAIKIDGIIYLRGLIDNGNSKEITQLPEGWRPQKQIYFSQASCGCAVSVYIQSDGWIRCNSSTPVEKFLSLNGISFIL